MENYDNFFNFNDQGRTPVYHTPDPVDPKDNKSGKKFTVITVLFVVIALIMCIAIVANVVVLASMKTQVSQDYADSMVDAVREEYINAINEYLADRDIPADVIAQIEDNVIKELTTSAAVVAGTKTIFSTVQVIAVDKDGIIRLRLPHHRDGLRRQHGKICRHQRSCRVEDRARDQHHRRRDLGRRHDHYIVQIRGV